MMDWLTLNQEDEPTWDDAYDLAASHCGQIPDGGCLKVGTEYCDWDCPFSAMDYEEEESESK